MSDFLELKNKNILIFGLANKKSVAFAIAKEAIDAGANLINIVKDDNLKTNSKKLFPDIPVFTCDVEKQTEIDNVAMQIKQHLNAPIHGMVHSLAFANYSQGLKPFHEVIREDFLQAINISAFSLIALANAFKEQLENNASVITISISTTRMASENYGYMAPVKAALESSLAFLNKSFSKFSNVRFNAVCPSLLKTSASAGIPGYIDSYMYAEKIIPRQKAITTKEAANTAIFLLSPRSSGIVAQTITVDAGMSINYFDANIIKKVNS